jgi:hypothetical protein
MAKPLAGVLLEQPLRLGAKAGGGQEGAGAQADFQDAAPRQRG